VKYAYYPGCSSEATAAAYEHSIAKVSEKLGLQLTPVDDWNCCGATEYFTLDRTVAHSVIARNLALVDDDTTELVASCSACYLNLQKTDHVMCDHADVCGRITESLAAGGLSYKPGRLRIRHLLDVVYEDVGEEAIRNAVVRPLHGLRVAPYYGCQITRPIDNGDDPEYPQRLDRILRWLGATVVDYPVKTHCCGGHMTQISEPQAHELIRRLLYSAEDYNADVITCLCPMCQLNLDAYQTQVNARFNSSFSLPVLFFTQLLGVAFGLPYSELGFGREIVAAEPVLSAKIQEQADEKKKPAKRKKNSKELPMPQGDH
jgi:heterodisulfide reductase subunit B